MKLSLEQITQLEKNWNAQTLHGVGCMTFGGRIQFTGDSQKSLARLRALESFKSKPAKLAPGDEEAPTRQALPREVDSEPEDLIEVTYRALTAGLLGDRPVDFSDEAALKKGVPLLNGQTVFKDHDTSVDNWVGRVVSTSWDTKTPGLPPGINARFQLDMIKDPMAVRGVLQGALHSASVTVSFQWKPSHPKLMEENRFFQYLGEEVEGQLVRIIVTKIDKFWEISLVWQGADEYAKQIDEDGAPLNTYDRSDSMNANLTAEVAKVVQAELSIQEDPMTPKIKEALKKMLGKEPTEDTIEALMTDFNAKAENSVAALTKKHAENVQELEVKISESLQKAEALEKRVAELAPQAELGAAHLESVRNEAIRLYKLCQGTDAKEVILKTLKAADLEVATAWKEEYSKAADEKFPPKCESCHSTRISRQSSVTEDTAGESKTLVNSPINEIQASRVRSLHE